MNQVFSAPAPLPQLTGRDRSRCRNMSDNALMRENRQRTDILPEGEACEAGNPPYKSNQAARQRGQRMPSTTWGLCGGCWETTQARAPPWSRH
jgi:hypothetical protein